jgi:hypothetical protein
MCRPRRPPRRDVRPPRSRPHGVPRPTVRESESQGFRLNPTARKGAAPPRARRTAGGGRVITLDCLWGGPGLAASGSPASTRRRRRRSAGCGAGCDGLAFCTPATTATTRRLARRTKATTGTGAATPDPTPRARGARCGGGGGGGPLPGTTALAHRRVLTAEWLTAAVRCAACCWTGCCGVPCRSGSAPPGQRVLEHAARLFRPAPASPEPR